MSLDAARAASKQNAAAVAAEIASLIAGTAVATSRGDCDNATEEHLAGGAASTNSCTTVAAGSAQSKVWSNTMAVSEDANAIQMDDY